MWKTEVLQKFPAYTGENTVPFSKKRNEASFDSKNELVLDMFKFEMILGHLSVTNQRRRYMI